MATLVNARLAEPLLVVHNAKGPHHAPAGGSEIQGHLFTGGEFTPGDGGSKPEAKPAPAKPEPEDDGPDHTQAVQDWIEHEGKHDDALRWLDSYRDEWGEDDPEEPEAFRDFIGDGMREDTPPYMHGHVDTIAKASDSDRLIKWLDDLRDEE